LAVVVGLGGFAAGTSATCSQCHARQAVALANSPHRNTACSACHFGARGPVFSRLDVVARMLPATLWGVRLEGPGHQIGSPTCASCHADMVQGTSLKKNGIAINHTQCIVGAACEDCHGASAHGTAVRYVRAQSMEACVACHRTKNAPLGCTTCHAEKTAATLQASSGTEWARIHGPDWKAKHGAGDTSTCASCHPAGFCKKCHQVDFPHDQKFGATHGGLSRTIGADACYSCHKGPEYCDGCHGFPIPHPAGFLQEHATIAQTVGDPRCRTCHVVDDCVECHVYHVHPGGSVSSVTKYGGSLY
jgi:hypothetical protein